MTTFKDSFPRPGCRCVLIQNAQNGEAWAARLTTETFQANVHVVLWLAAKASGRAEMANPP